MRPMQTGSGEALQTSTATAPPCVEEEAIEDMRHVSVCNMSYFSNMSNMTYFSRNISNMRYEEYEQMQMSNMCRGRLRI